MSFQRFITDDFSSISNFSNPPSSKRETSTAGAAITARIDALRPLVPAAGPLPLLVLPGVVAVAGCCLTCGDSLDAGRQYRCAPCVAAVEAVLNEIREG